jgi:Fe-S cluster biogenesis protein NfuA
MAQILFLESPSYASVPLHSSLSVTISPWKRSIIDMRSAAMTSSTSFVAPALPSADSLTAQARLRAVSRCRARTAYGAYTTTTAASSPRMVSTPDSPPKVSPVPTATPEGAGGETLALTLENVEMVLDEMRPYLMADGGNVTVSDIDGATVRLQLEGACGSCPSSTMTMKMGLERRLLEKIPEIEAVVQVEAEGPPLTEDGIERTLNEVRPFLNVAGGTIELIELIAESAVPTARLRMTGAGAAINSVKVEITHRLKRNYNKLANVTFES